MRAHHDQAGRRRARLSSLVILFDSNILLNAHREGQEHG
jgi:hypothetical protein